MKASTAAIAFVPRSVGAGVSSHRSPKDGCTIIWFKTGRINGLSKFDALKAWFVKVSVSRISAIISATNRWNNRSRCSASESV
jgi:hypothetical protein